MKFFGGLKSKLLPKWGSPKQTDDSPASSGRVRQILDDLPAPTSADEPPSMVPQAPTTYAPDTHYSPDTHGRQSLALESEGGDTLSRVRRHTNHRPASSHHRRTPGKPPSRKLPRRPTTQRPTTAANSWATFKFGKYNMAPSTYTAPPSTYIVGQSMYSSMTSPSARIGAETDDGHEDEEHQEDEEHEEHQVNEEHEEESRLGTEHDHGTEQLSPILPTEDGTNSEYYPQNNYPQSSVFPETATQGGAPSIFTEGVSQYPPESLVIGNHPYMVDDEGRTMTMTRTGTGTFTEEPLTPPGKEGLSRPATSIMSPIEPRYRMSRRTTMTSRRERETVASTRLSQLGTQSEVGTTGGDLTRTNTIMSKSTRPPRRRRNKRDTRISNYSKNGQNLVASPKSMRTGGTSIRTSNRTSVVSQSLSPQSSNSRRLNNRTRANTRSNVRSSIFVRIPTKRFSHRPFHYFHRYPEVRSGDLSKLDLEGIPSIAGTESTATTRTYISSRVGRLRRLLKDFVAMPWRADSDCYYGETGITAAHHFKSHGGVGGGVSARPKRDSRIPRQPWYRPKPKKPVGVMKMRDNGMGFMAYPGIRSGMGSGPLTDGSDRNTMDRYALPLSASPFVSPFESMRSPHETPVVETPPTQFPHPTGPMYHQRMPSRSASSRSSKSGSPPIVISNPFGKGLSRSPSTDTSGSHSRQTHRNQHALLESYGQGGVGMPPPIPEGISLPSAHPDGTSPPSAHPDGHFPQPPQPQLQLQLQSQQYLPTGTNAYSQSPPLPPAPAIQAYPAPGPTGAPGIMIHSPGTAPVWVPIHASPTHQTPQALYMMPNGMPQGYQVAQPSGIPGYQMGHRAGVPVTMHATGSSAGVPSRMRSSRRTKGMTTQNVTPTTEYFPTSGIEIGAAV
ncbi:hypothetical protein FRB93_000215 [Tulasnella sp. JGI-2019a]|nr:hypothetical protein FRB93_000215 [Tulasnella sp. JGI-2019a]